MQEKINISESLQSPDYKVTVDPPPNSGPYNQSAYS